MDIEAIKWCHPDQPSIPGQELDIGVKETGEQRKLLQPVIFVRYAATDSTQESYLVDRKAIDHSAKELSDEGISQKRISCSLDEIQYVVSLLQEHEACVDEAYRAKWTEKSALNGTMFRLSLLRPTLEPLFPYRTAQLKLRAERQAREVKGIEQLARRQRRFERMVMLEVEDQQRKDELEMRLARDEIVDRVCSKPGCEEWALLQCARCPNVVYCRLSRKSIGSVVITPTSLCANVFLSHTAFHTNADQRQDWVQRHGEVCLSEQYVKCALPSCLVRVLIGYTDPSRPFQVNEETTLCRKVMYVASGSAVPALRYFCSQAHCEEGKGDHEVTMKEYKSALARREKELERKLAEFKAAVDQKRLEMDQNNAELDEALENVTRNHELKLHELKTDVHKSKRSSNDMKEFMARERVNLFRIFRKKEILEIRRDVAERIVLILRAIELTIVREIDFHEEREAFFCEKLVGDEKALQEHLLRLREDNEESHNALLQVRESISFNEDLKLSACKELDAINAELASNDKDASHAAATTVADLGPVKTPLEQQKPEQLKPEFPTMELIRKKERELVQMRKEILADFDTFNKQVEELDKSNADLEEELKCEEEKYELQLRELKKDLYTSKQSFMEMGETMKQATRSLYLTFRKKELTIEQNRTTLMSLKLQGRETQNMRAVDLHQLREEIVVMHREYYEKKGDKKALEQLALRQRSEEEKRLQQGGVEREFALRDLISTRKNIQDMVEHEIILCKALDAVNAELDSNSKGSTTDTTTATTTAADSDPVKMPAEPAPADILLSTSVVTDKLPSVSPPFAASPSSDSQKVTSPLEENMKEQEQEEVEENATREAVDRKVAFEEVVRETLTTSAADPGPVNTMAKPAPADILLSTSSVTDNPPSAPAASPSSESEKVLSPLDETMKKEEEQEEQEQEEKEKKEAEERKVAHEEVVREKQADLKKKKDLMDNLDRKTGEQTQKLRDMGALTADGITIRAGLANIAIRKDLTEEEALVVDPIAATILKYCKLRRSLERGYDIKKCELDIEIRKYYKSELEEEVTVLIRKIDNKIESAPTDGSCNERDEEQVRVYQEKLVKVLQVINDTNSQLALLKQRLLELLAEGEGDGLVLAPPKPTPSVSPPPPSAAAAAAAANGEHPGLKAWHSMKHTSRRASMIEPIIACLKQTHGGIPELIEKIPRMAKRMENELYMQAKSLAEYSDPVTLRNRLLKVIVDLKSNNSTPVFVPPAERKDASAAAGAVEPPVTATTATAAKGEGKTRMFRKYALDKLS